MARSHFGVYTRIWKDPDWTSLFVAEQGFIHALASLPQSVDRPVPFAALRDRYGRPETSNWFELLLSCVEKEWIDCPSGGAVLSPKALRFFRPCTHDRDYIPAAVRQQVYERDGHRCVTCNTTERLTLDHIRPWSLGGSDDESNLQAMCLPCNVRKSNAWAG